MSTRPKEILCLELLLKDVLDTILCAENNNSATKEYTSIHSQIIEISVNLDPRVTKKTNKQTKNNQDQEEQFLA